MPDQVTWSAKIQISGGPSISTAKSFEVTGYDKVEVAVPGEDKANPAEPASSAANLAALTDVTGEIQPASAAERIEAVAISSTAYGSDLIYSVTGGVQNVSLDAAHVLVGEGAVVNFLDAAPETLVFQNGMGVGNDAVVTVIVARQATA